MTQTEHLHLIRARCVELLEIAEKRTPTEWYESQNRCAIFSRHDRKRVAHADRDCGDATFIASCAGAAEAGWLATIAAIDAFFKLDGVTYGWDGDCGATCIADIMTDSITAAWPIELLNNK